jgi:hypothetical protein
LRWREQQRCETIHSASESFEPEDPAPQGQRPEEDDTQEATPTGGLPAYSLVTGSVFLGTKPDDSWDMGQVRNRDMLTLQTCIPPTFENRLIVRADRA